METLQDSNDDIRNKSLTLLEQSVSEFVKSQKLVLSQALTNLQQNGSVVLDNLRMDKEQIRKELRDELKTPTVLFNARHLGFDTNMKGKTLVFNDILLNKGGGYNKGNGIFTAPVDGTYIFNVQACPEEDHRVLLHIKADSKVIGMLNFHNALGRDGPCVSANGVAVLSKGSQVFVMCYDTSSTGDVLFNEAGEKAGMYFSGVLVHTGTN